MNELHHIWFGYFVPSLQGNGPEDLFHLALLGLAGWVATRVGKKIVAEWREHRDAHRALLHHIIVNHPDIPNHVPGLDPKHQPQSPPEETPCS